MFFCPLHYLSNYGSTYSLLSRGVLHKLRLELLQEKNYLRLKQLKLHGQKGSSLVKGLFRKEE